jgi:mono/diheme cytochrome c family protein
MPRGFAPFARSLTAAPKRELIFGGDSGTTWKSGQAEATRETPMTNFNPLTMALLATTAAVANVHAQTADPAVGRRLAEAVCSACHQVGPVSTPQPANSDAPSFLDISRMSSTNELAIKVFLRSSHPTMPNIMLDQEETDSIAAYIVGLALAKP